MRACSSSCREGGSGVRGQESVHDRTDDALQFRGRAAAEREEAVLEPPEREFTARSTGSALDGHVAIRVKAVTHWWA